MIAHEAHHGAEAAGNEDDGGAAGRGQLRLRLGAGVQGVCSSCCRGTGQMGDQGV